ncbi:MULTISPECIES: hypothetical protein [Alphaproteobacteria]|uniref:hypothetical protein n=1 Tax=Alphaproteobacteria TaxID=28211 RepID=UPI002607154B|nr:MULTISPECIES: hypothetical protein [Alphaproteobacteria]
MRIHQAIAIAKADEHRLIRFIEPRNRFLDALDWNALPEQMAREASMMDELLATELAESACYVIWLEECVAFGVEDIVGVLRFEAAPRAWQTAWVTL